MIRFEPIESKYCAFTSQIRKSKLLTAFTLQNRVGNQNRNREAHPNWGMGNRRLIFKGVVGMSLPFLRMTILHLHKIKTTHFALNILLLINYLFITIN